MNKTAEEAACYAGQSDCAQLLIKSGSNIFACDKDGNGVLHLTAIRGHARLLQQLLVKAEAQAITAQLTAAVNLSGFTPLHYAAFAGSTDCVRQLLTAGVDQLQGNWGEYDRWLVVPCGSRPLHVAALHFKASACIALLEMYALQLQESLPGDPLPVDPRTLVTAQGSTPYALALWKGMPANCALAVALNQRADVRTVIHPDSLQRTAAMRRKGPRSLRFIAAELAKQHLLHQLSALAAQHVQQKRVLQQQAVLLQQQRRSQSYKRLHAPHHAEHAQSPLHRTTSSSKRLAVSSRSTAQQASTPTPPPATAVAIAHLAAAGEAQQQLCLSAGDGACRTSSLTPHRRSSEATTICSASSITQAGKPPVYPDVLQPQQLHVLTSARQSDGEAQQPADAVGGLPGAIASFSNPTAATRTESSAAATCAMQGSFSSQRCSAIAEMDSDGQQQQQQHSQDNLAVQEGAVPAVADGRVGSSRDVNGRAYISEIEIEELPTEETAAAAAADVDDEDLCIVRVVEGGGSAPDALKSKAHMQQQQLQEQKRQADVASLQVQLAAPGSLLAASCADGRVSRSGSATLAAGGSRKSLLVALFCRTRHGGGGRIESPAGSEQQQVQDSQHLQQQQQQVGQDQLALLNSGSGTAGPSSVACSMSSPGSTSSSRRSSGAGFAGFLPHHHHPQQHHQQQRQSASGGSASLLFGANMQHIARMVQEAHLDDAGSLSYHALTRHSRTGSMLAATSLAGALPGCISDALSHLYDSHSFIQSISGMQHGSTAAASTAAAGGVGVGVAAVDDASQQGRPSSRVSSRVSSSRLLSGFALRGTSGMSLDGVTNRATAAPPSFSGSMMSISHGEEVCGVCLDKGNEVVLAGCQHQLCFDCARCIVGEGVGCRPPLCPFCRMCMTRFKLLEVTVPAAVLLEAVLAAGGSK